MHVLMQLTCSGCCQLQTVLWGYRPTQLQLQGCGSSSSRQAHCIVCRTQLRRCFKLLMKHIMCTPAVHASVLLHNKTAPQRSRAPTSACMSASAYEHSSAEVGGCHIYASQCALLSTRSPMQPHMQLPEPFINQAHMISQIALTLLLLLPLLLICHACLVFVHGESACTMHELPTYCHTTSGAGHCCFPCGSLPAVPLHV